LERKHRNHRASIAPEALSSNQIVHLAASSRFFELIAESCQDRYPPRTGIYIDMTPWEIDQLRASAAEGALAVRCITSVMRNRLDFNRQASCSQQCFSV
jgi:hypothetical protein